MKVTLLYAIAILALASCNDVSDNSNLTKPKPIVKATTESLCDVAFLKSRARQLLTDLKTEELSRISLNYQNADTSDSLIKYAFFPNLDKAAIFNFSKWSKDEIISAHILGDYEDGKLVIFHKGDVINYSGFVKREKKFETFFVCNYICEKDRWKISAKHSCFEESGAPFEN